MRGVPTQPVARGFRGRDPVAVFEIQDADGTVLWQYDQANAANCGTLDVCNPLLQENLAYVINDILADQIDALAGAGSGQRA